MNSACTAGALVKVMQSSPPEQAASIRRSTRSSVSSVSIHRYGSTVSTRACASCRRTSCDGFRNPCNCTAIVSPVGYVASTSSMSDSVVSSALMPTSLSPAARMPPRAFGPRTRIAVSASASTRSSPRPAASATSNQRRTPYAVVASSTSGRASMIARVSAITGSSEIAFAIRSVGACSTCAPRRASASMRSAERRSLVTPMRNPSSWSGRKRRRRLHHVGHVATAANAGRALHEIGCLGIAVVREAHDLADDHDRG